MGCYICITDVQKSIDKISGQAKQGQYIIQCVVKPLALAMGI